MANKSDLHFGGELKLMAVSQTYKSSSLLGGGGGSVDDSFAVISWNS